ncbi:MAG: CoA transferase, partial [Acidimicrobiales bacterium]
MSAAPLPLEGLRVVDLTRYVAGPYCTMQLADAGADVIKVEPVGGEVTRTLEPLINGSAGKPLSGYFLRYNRYKRSICLDLASTHGKQILTELLRVSDVLVENYRPDVLSDLGFGEDALGEINPQLIYCSVTGYGHSDGPYRNRPA